MALTELKLRALKAQDKAYKVFDGKGLFVLVTPVGNKLWRFKYISLGKEKLCTFGSYPDFSLAEARAEGDRLRRMFVQGIDPQQQKKAALPTSPQAQQQQQEIREGKARIGYQCGNLLLCRIRRCIM